MKAQELIDKGEPKTGQVRATELLRWVAENRDAYPIPDGVAACDHVHYDLPVTVNFDVTDWVSVSKAHFAKHCLFVAQSQVSRWIKAGMPVRADGRLNYHEALEWVCQYRDANLTRQASGWRD